MIPVIYQNYKRKEGIVKLSGICQIGQHEKANAKLPRLSVSIFPDVPRCQTLAVQVGVKRGEPINVFGLV